MMKMRTQCGGLMVLMVLVAMSGCARKDYTGQYSGQEILIVPGAQAQAVNVSLNLEQNSDSVVGDYSGPDVTGVFRAKVNNDDLLEQVSLITSSSVPYSYGGLPSSSYGSYCTGNFTGSLMGAEDGESINGSLTASQTPTGCGTVSRNLNLRKVAAE
jgi:hypothetical protein